MFACCCTPSEDTIGQPVMQIPALEERETAQAQPVIINQQPKATATLPVPKDEAKPKDLSYVPPPPASQANDKNTVTVVLQKDKNRLKGPLGWRLDCVAKSVLYVFEVSSDTATPVYNYNNSVPEDMRVKVGDFITSVNGHSDSDRMTLAIEHDESLTLVLKRPVAKHVTVRKNGQSLGMELKYWQAGTTLMVGAINAGAVKSQGIDVQSGDRIVSVNGAAGSSDTLLSSLRGSDTLELGLARCLP